MNNLYQRQLEISDKASLGKLISIREIKEFSIKTSNFLPTNFNNKREFKTETKMWQHSKELTEEQRESKLKRLRKEVEETYTPEFIVATDDYFFNRRLSNEEILRLIENGTIPTLK